MNEKDFICEIQEAIDTIHALEQTCLVKHFHLVKIILPTPILNEIKIKYAGTVNVETVEKSAGIPCPFMGVPVEEDPYATKIRYVIEGELKLL